MRRFLVPALIILCAAGILLYLHGRSNRDAALQIGVVRETEVHISTEINARLVSIPVKSGEKVHKGELIALLSSPELAASLDHAKASELQSRADRANVYAGVRKEEIDISTRAVAIADQTSRLPVSSLTVRRHWPRKTMSASRNWMRPTIRCGKRRPILHNCGQLPPKAKRDRRMTSAPSPTQKYFWPRQQLRISRLNLPRCG